MARRKTETTTKRVFPRTLYKAAHRGDQGATEWGSANTSHGGAFHSVLVENEEERKAAIEIGYIDDFAKARAMAPGDTAPAIEDEPEEETPVADDEEERTVEGEKTSVADEGF